MLFAPSCWYRDHADGRYESEIGVCIMRGGEQERKALFEGSSEVKLDANSTARDDGLEHVEFQAK